MGILRVCRLLYVGPDGTDVGGLIVLLGTAFNEVWAYAFSDEGDASSTDPSWSSPEYSPSSSPERL